MQISVEGRNTEVRKSWQTTIEAKLAKLERYPNEITHARVTITHSPHHQVGDNEVRIVLSVAGRTLTVKKNGALILAVLRSALTAAERELNSYHQSRQRFVKVTPSPSLVEAAATLPTPPPARPTTATKKAASTRAKKSVSRT